MSANKIQAELRSDFGKGAARQARRAGKVPAVIYGHGAEPMHVLLPAHETSLAVRQTNALLDIALDGESHLALVKEVQRDIMRQSVNHVDLLTVRRGERVEVEVNVHVEGEAVPNAVVNLELNTLLVEADATQLPDSITFNVEGREMGEHVAASEITLPEGVTLITDPETIVITVSEPQAMDLGEDAEGAESASEGEESSSDSE
jgi:large subunit ribosomal protein L25